jgi:hypothetical protein
MTFALLPRDIDLAARAIERVDQANAPRLRSFISDYSSRGLNYNDRTPIYKWVTRCVLTSSPAEMMHGFDLGELYERCRNLFPKEAAGLTENDLFKTLRRTSRTQRSLDIQPVIVEFNSNAERLNVVDRSFVLFVAQSGWRTCADT